MAPTFCASRQLADIDRVSVAMTATSSRPSTATWALSVMTSELLTSLRVTAPLADVVGARPCALTFQTASQLPRSDQPKLTGDHGGQLGLLEDGVVDRNIGRVGEARLVEADEIEVGLGACDGVLGGRERVGRQRLALRAGRCWRRA